MRYVALLRGIGPGNPDMRNDKLRAVLTSVGLDRVESVISSGNLLFDSDRRSSPALEAIIETAWPQHLGFRSATIVRSSRRFREVVVRAPFDHHDDRAEGRLQVTFLKRPSEPGPEGLEPVGDGWAILGRTPDTVYWSVDTTRSTTPEVMRLLERSFDTDITTRTWKTVQRIAAKLA